MLCKFERHFGPVAKFQTRARVLEGFLGLLLGIPDHFFFFFGGGAGEVPSKSSKPKRPHVFYSVNAKESRTKRSGC